MKRLFDLFLAFLFLFLFAWLYILLVIAIKFSSKGPVLYWSSRVGVNNKLFNMPKFRSMKEDTPIIATHLIIRPEEYLTRIGRFIRRSSLDELPQLYSIIKGDMSFVGPRPALFNQDDLIALRSKKGIDKLLPGVTGLAQINGRDELSISEKVIFEIEYLENRSFWLDLKIIFMTFIKVINNNGISH